VKPIRIALFAPGNKERVMTKALESEADAVILDLEDSAPIASKAQARLLVVMVIDAVAAPGAARSQPAVFVRKNGVTSWLRHGNAVHSSGCKSRLGNC
jgi:citrate lyase subunit beta/citryl-CoA lyase